MSSPYLIWSNEHHSWWRPNKSGYTQDLYQAGEYNPAEVFEILSQSSLGSEPEHPNEVAVEKTTGLTFRVEYSGVSKNIPPHLTIRRTE